jgi:hypothetical protein
MDMPEPPGSDESKNAEGALGMRPGFAELLARRIAATGIDADGRHGRLILIRNLACRRKLRRYSSARTSVTDFSLLFVALAYVPQTSEQRMMITERITDPLQKSRLDRTLAEPVTMSHWTTAQAVRLMAAVDETARTLGGTAEWILEGVDWKAVAEILTVPADHEVRGMITVNLSDQEFHDARWSETGPAPLDFDGFHGGFS